MDLLSGSLLDTIVTPGGMASTSSVKVAGLSLVVLRYFGMSLNFYKFIYWALGATTSNVQNSFWL